MSPRRILTLTRPFLRVEILTAPVYNCSKNHTRDYWLAPKHDPDRVLRLSVTQIDRARCVARLGTCALEIALHAQPSVERLAQWMRESIASQTRA
jgi:hypothetical protein